MKEAWEAGEWVERHALGQAALKWMCASLEPLLGADRAVGGKELRQQLTSRLSSQRRSDC